MKSESYNIYDMQNILVVPKSTILARIRIFGFKPIEKRKHRSRTKHYYSKEQLSKLKGYFQSEAYKPTPPELLQKIVRYELDEYKNCIIVVQSKMNYTNAI